MRFFYYVINMFKRVINECHYITNDDTIIIYPYNKKETDYNISIYHKKLMFSDREIELGIFDTYSYNNIQKLIIHNSKFNQPILNLLHNLINLTEITLGHHFSQPLSNSLDNLTNLTMITFGYEFNMSLSNSLDKLTKLTQITFGYKFNKSLDNSLNKLINLKYLIFSDYFDQALTNSLNKLINLTHLTFGYSFNHPLSNSLYYLTKLEHLTLGHKFDQELNLSPSIKILTLNCNNQNLVDNLPNSVEQLNLDHDFRFPLLDNLPSSIKKMLLLSSSSYNEPLNNLPRSLEELELPRIYKLKIKNIPPRLKKIICSKSYEFIDDFTGLEILYH